MVEVEANRPWNHEIKLTAEEERFAQTLATGMRLFEEIAASGGDSVTFHVEATTDTAGVRRGRAVCRPDHGKAASKNAIIVA